jgi:hypothetical protein
VTPNRKIYKGVLLFISMKKEVLNKLTKEGREKIIRLEKELSVIDKQLKELNLKLESEIPTL